MRLTAQNLFRLSTFIPLVLFAILYLFSDYMVDIEENRLKELERSRVLLETSAARAKLESELNSTLYIATGLTGYVVVNPSLAGSKKIRKILQILFQGGHHLRNIGLAPNNILTHIYPVAGNEKAIGLRYQNHPKQWPAVKRAMDSRTTVLAGPVNLVQGGRGLISRTPVFLDNGKYWGVLSLVIDIDSLFTAAGIKAKQNNVKFAIRGKDGLGKAGSLFFGQQAIFKQNPILLNLSIPGGKWQLAAIPAQGWGSNLAYLKYYRLGAITIALLLSVMLWVILEDRRAIKHIALHDPLTGLANRRLFNERLSYTVAQKQRHKEPFALIAIDMDKFKPINDQHGHKTGDEVLREVSRRLLSHVRDEDTVARLGGDEFCVILPSTGDQGSTLKVANKLRDTLNKPFVNQGIQLDLSASIGISLYPDDGKSVDELLRSADMAMYQAKQAGGGRIASNTTTV